MEDINGMAVAGPRFTESRGFGDMLEAIKTRCGQVYADVIASGSKLSWLYRTPPKNLKKIISEVTSIVESLPEDMRDLRTGI